MNKKASDSDFRSIRMSTIDIGQAIDGLEARAEAYERTADYLDGKPSSEIFLAEEVSHSREARAIARHFRAIIAVLEKAR